MKIARLAALTIALAAFVSLTACPRPLPNPGQVVITCTMDAVRDPRVIQAVMDALAQPDFRSKLAAIIGALPGVTAEVVGCILQSYLGQLGADPAHAQQYSRARTYLSEHGYEVR